MLKEYRENADAIEDAIKNPAPAKESNDIFDSFGFYFFSDLSEADRQPPQFIIESLIPVGMSFLSGAPKTRKSFMALQMAHAVATGSTFLGFKTLQCDVVYLDLEGSKSRISSRADIMQLQFPDNILITNRVQDKISGALIDRIRELHRQRPSIRFVIIDTYSRARGTIRSGNANAYDSDVQILEPIQQMALDENIAILFIHHDKKGAGLMADSFERINGTMGISGSADSVINLISEGKRFEGIANLEYNPRDVKGGEFKLRFDEFTCRWERDNASPDIKGNPVIRFCIENAPRPHLEGDFFSYSLVYRTAYGCDTQNPGDKIRAAVKEHGAALYNEYGIGIQLGVQSKNARGLRIFNCN